MFFTLYYLLTRWNLLPGMTMERAKMELNPPRDKLRLVFLTLMIHGVGTLMPWNMFITAKSVSYRRRLLVRLNAKDAYKVFSCRSYSTS